MSPAGMGGEVETEATVAKTDMPALTSSVAGDSAGVEVPAVKHGSGVQDAQIRAEGAASSPATAPAATGESTAEAAAISAAPAPAAVDGPKPAQAEGGAGAGAGAGAGEVAALRVQDGNRQNHPKMLDKLYTCKWKNGTLQTARVVERRLDKNGNWEYYMHYEDFDRRLDEWVCGDRLGDEVVKHRSSGEVASAESNQKMTRTQKRRFDEIHTTMPVEQDPTTAALEHEREQATKVKNIQTVELGQYEMETWYYSPYPEEFSKCNKLFLCEFCLKYFRKGKTLERHKGKCEWRHPPGDEIYRHDNVSMFEVDGKKAKIFCQSLCLLSKLFLDHKTLYYDVDPFLFYVLTEVDKKGAHVVGYFSKEKESPDEHNLACIMVLPPHQRKRYGRFLISFSYELSKKEGRVGTPERPLSDLGLLGYRSYWKSVLLELLSKQKAQLSIKDMSLMTAIRPDDIITTLQSMGLIKYWKGQHLISVSPKVIEEHLSRQANRNFIVFDESKLNWVPPAKEPQAARKTR